jgi:hypothetical protein
MLPGSTRVLPGTSLDESIPDPPTELFVIRAPIRAFHPSALAPIPLLLLSSCGGASTGDGAVAPASTSSAITAADLRTRLYSFADDSMQGRRSGTAGNVKATDWIAVEARGIGLEPAGEDGGWFQTVPILQRTLEPATALTVEGHIFKAWDDMIPRDQGTGARPVDGAPRSTAEPGTVSSSRRSRSRASWWW